MTELKLFLQELLGHTGEAWPWWIYLLTGLVPLLIFLGFRELCCWFWKFNSIDDRLKKIEQHLSVISQLAEEFSEEKSTEEVPKDFTLK